MIALAVGSVSIVESVLFTVNATRVEGADGVQVPLTTQSYPLPAVTVSLVAVGVTLKLAVVAPAMLPPLLRFTAFLRH